MARISDFASLSQAVGDYLDRPELTGFIPNFIQNAESRIFRELRVSAMETTTALSISGGLATIPTDFLELKRAYIDGTPITWLDKVSVETVYSRYPDRSATTPAGTPKLIAEEGGSFIFGPRPSDSTLQIAYYAKFDPLTIATPTNWLVVNAPDVLLWGALVDASQFLSADQRVPVWLTLYQGAMQGLQEQDRRRQRSGSSPKSFVQQSP